MPVILLLFISVFMHAVTVSIPNGASSKWIANHLEDVGVVTRALPLYAYFRLKSVDQSLQSGEFEIDRGASYKTITDILTGKVQQTISVTIPEGYTIKEIAQQLKKHRVIESEADFLGYLNGAVFSDFSSTQWVSKLPTKNLEGYLFPDTYYFSRRMSHPRIIRAFIQRFNEMAVPLYQASETTLSLHQVITLASIIEKEAGTVDEMSLISGVFHNRLKQNMHLASCPTVGYAMGKPRKKFLTYKDLDVQSPYNTYRNRGLPPTPISAAGKRAIQAALYPQKTTFLYFISRADGSGRHEFSTNLRDHLNHQKRMMANQ